MIFKAGNKTIHYSPTPKCGGTSIKVMIRKGVEGIIDYENKIHSRFPTRPFIEVEADIKFCIVRDPVDRFLSAYLNRIVHHGEMPFVEFDDFVDNFYEKYYRFDKNIHHHFRPQVDFIGHSPSYYNRIFLFNEIPSVCEFLSEIMGKQIKLEHKQVTKGGEKPIPTESQIDSIKSFYEDDYKFLEQIKR
jgi:hypothetical protein